MKATRFFTVILIIVITNCCAPLRTPTIIKNEATEGYEYIFIPPTTNLTSGSGGVYGGQYGVIGATTSNSVNPGDVISGILLKKGYTRIPELKPELLDKTMVVNYGESGKRDRGFEYSLEVTVQFISAKTHAKICSCTAEGKGETEADNIRDAITRCLTGLLGK